MNGESKRRGFARTTRKTAEDEGPSQPASLTILQAFVERIPN